MIQACESYFWGYVEKGLLPLPEEKQYCCVEKVTLIALRAIRAAIALPLALTFSLLSKVFCCLSKPLANHHFEPISLTDVIPQDIPFSVGAAMSDYQGDGKVNCPDAQWSAFEEELVRKGQLRPENMSGTGIDLSKRTDEIIAILKRQNLTTYRFSLEWSKIEPREGEFNEQALHDYVTLCHKLIGNGIQPMITLQHFTLPKWFADKGGFEAQDNIKFFVRFCEKMARFLPRSVTHFCTINEPNIYAFLGYILGKGPPGKTLNFSLATKVYENLLKAHQAAYRVIKQIRPETKVGITHQYLRMESGSSLTYLVCKYLNAFLNDAFLKILRGEEARVSVPFLANRKIELKEPFEADFIGAQFYAVPYITACGSRPRDGEKMTEMEYSDNYQVAYEALKALHAAAPNTDIQVTEFGIATLDPEQRARYYRGAMRCMAKAMLEGVPLKGIMPWSLVDNWEWPTDKEGGGFTKHFGINAYDPESGKITPRAGIEPILELARAIASRNRIAV